VQVIVRTYVQDADSPKKELSNIFQFTFVEPSPKKLRQVYPATYFDNMLYLWGRRGIESSRVVAQNMGSEFSEYF